MPAAPAGNHFPGRPGRRGVTRYIQTFASRGLERENGGDLLRGRARHVETCMGTAEIMIKTCVGTAEIMIKTFVGTAEITIKTFVGTAEIVLGKAAVDPAGGV